MNKIIYIVEGQIEDKFFKQMRESDLFSPGKVFIFNLMQEKLKPSSNILTKKLDEVNAVIDTDIIVVQLSGYYSFTPIHTNERSVAHD